MVSELPFSHIFDRIEFQNVNSKGIWFLWKQKYPFLSLDLSECNGRDKISMKCYLLIWILHLPYERGDVSPAGNSRQIGECSFHENQPAFMCRQRGREPWESSSSISAIRGTVASGTIIQEDKTLTHTDSFMHVLSFYLSAVILPDLHPSLTPGFNFPTLHDKLFAVISILK